MSRFIPSLRIIYRPDGAFRALGAAPPRWYVSLAVQVLPLSLLCVVAWPSVSAVVAIVVAVTLLGLGFFVLAPWFEVARSWDRSFAIAAHASTPVLLSWVLLLYPPLMVLPVVALLHCFALCYVGVQRVLGCRESEAAMMVAAGWIFAGICGTLVGGLCSAAGLI